MDEFPMATMAWGGRGVNPMGDGSRQSAFPPPLCRIYAAYDGKVTTPGNPSMQQSLIPHGGSILWRRSTLVLPNTSVEGHGGIVTEARGGNCSP
ncbi:hypothetical protein TIFTF001_028145 [Ficus carica]|uniref:Uncharacterized protein n=1 Tax=Ficus carica TaxID=3494 RepID=A0AA88DPR5_FICCA|nr:hypothetical protein TIFTF001_028145 [Ficus carica]